jgi:hypothetical protein
LFDGRVQSESSFFRSAATHNHAGACQTRLTDAAAFVSPHHLDDTN